VRLPFFAFLQTGAVFPSFLCVFLFLHVAFSGTFTLIAPYAMLVDVVGTSMGDG
jgi:hypothetical protein